MENLRAQIENDLAETLEGEFAMPVQITYADGTTQMYKKGTSVLLSGQVLYFTRSETNETGEPIVVNMPVVSLRISSLEQMPVPGDKCHIRFAISPVAGAPTRDWVFSADRAAEDGTDIGFMRFYPQQLENESEDVSS